MPSRTAFTLLAQLLGGAYIAPLYFFIHYIESDIQRYATEETRKVEKLSQRTILLTIGIAYLLPRVLMFHVPGLENRQWINGVFLARRPLLKYVIQGGLGGADRVIQALLLRQQQPLPVAGSAAAIEDPHMRYCCSAE